MSESKNSDQYITETELGDAEEMLGAGYGDDEQKISDASDLRKYRIELPNLYDDSNLDPYEFRLLAHYKRVGVCTESTRMTAEKCKMSAGIVSQKRKSIAEKGFIKMQEKNLPGGGYSFVITVLDLWKENFKKYSTRSPHEQRVHHMNAPVHSVKQRINHIKKEPDKKKEGALRANQIPEIVLYREVAEIYPPHELFDSVVDSMDKVRSRLGRDAVCEDLLPFRRAWVSKGYNRFAITWLEWAETGVIPKNGTWQSSKKSTDHVKNAPIPTAEQLAELRARADKEFGKQP